METIDPLGDQQTTSTIIENTVVKNRLFKAISNEMVSLIQLMISIFDQNCSG